MTENLAKTTSSLPNVSLDSNALAAECGTATFYVPKDDHMLAFLANWSGQTVNELSIPVDTLDRIAASYSAPALLKIDVEGAEDLVLQGGTHLLQSSAPPIIFFKQVPKAAAFGYPPVPPSGGSSKLDSLRFTGFFPPASWSPFLWSTMAWRTCWRCRITWPDASIHRLFADRSYR